jgi:hypothetical protein
MNVLISYLLLGYYLTLFRGLLAIQLIWNIKLRELQYLWSIWDSTLSNNRRHICHYIGIIRDLIFNLLSYNVLHICN